MSECSSPVTTKVIQNKGISGIGSGTKNLVKKL